MRSQRCFVSLAVIALALAASVAWATAQRTFVSAIGTDSPNCSIAAPCRSFTAAMNATSPGGEIIVLDSAGYGPVTITKSVSIIAPPGVYAGITVTAGDGITINTPGGIVVLRGLTINGQGGNHGILLQQAARVRIENCVVSSMGAVGIYHTAADAEMIVTDTIVRDNTDGLGLVAANASILLDHVRSEHNTNAGFYMAPTNSPDYVRATIVDSVIVYNGHGIWADTLGNAITDIDVQRTIVSDNRGNGFRATAGASLSLAYVVLKHNTFMRNAENSGQNGVLLLTTFGGISANVSDNALRGHITADGTSSVVSVSANDGLGSLLKCVNGGTVRTYDNNSVSGYSCSNIIHVTGY